MEVAHVGRTSTDQNNEVGLYSRMRNSLLELENRYSSDNEPVVSSQPIIAVATSIYLFSHILTAENIIRINKGLAHRVESGVRWISTVYLVFKTVKATVGKVQLGIVNCWACVWAVVQWPTSRAWRRDDGSQRGERLRHPAQDSGRYAPVAISTSRHYNAFGKQLIASWALWRDNIRFYNTYLVFHYIWFSIAFIQNIVTIL